MTMVMVSEFIGSGPELAGIWAETRYPTSLHSLFDSPHTTTLSPIMSEEGAAPEDYSNWNMPAFPEQSGPDGEHTPISSPRIMAALSRAWFASLLTCSSPCLGGREPNLWLGSHV
jgi:hypothetical protein